jgi:hypothetical protein
MARVKVHTDELRESDGSFGPLPEVDADAYTPESQPLPDPEPAPQLPTMPTIAAIPGADGWYGNADWIRVECDGESPWEMLKPREGFPPLWAEIDATLTFGEALAIPIQSGIPLIKLFAHIAPRVRAWNVMEFDAETGTMVDVPPPAEIGTAALMRCRPAVAEWLAWTLRQTTLSGGPNRKNATTPSDATSGG